MIRQGATCIKPVLSFMATAIMHWLIIHEAMWKMLSNYRVNFLKYPLLSSGGYYHWPYLVPSSTSRSNVYFRWLMLLSTRRIGSHASVINQAIKRQYFTLMKLLNVTDYLLYPTLGRNNSDPRWHSSFIDCLLPIAGGCNDWAKKAEIGLTFLKLHLFGDSTRLLSYKMDD